MTDGDDGEGRRWGGIGDGGSGDNRMKLEDIVPHVIALNILSARKVITTDQRTS